MRGHIHDRHWRVEGTSGRLRPDFCKDRVRPQSFHGKRLRINLGDRLDGEGIGHVTLRDHLVIGGNDCDAEQLGIHLREIGNVIGILPVGVVLEFVVRLLNYGNHEFASGSNRTGSALLGEKSTWNDNCCDRNHHKERYWHPLRLHCDSP